MFLTNFQSFDQVKKYFRDQWEGIEEEVEQAIESVAAYHIDYKDDYDSYAVDVWAELLNLVPSLV